MDSFEVNKYLGWALATILFLLCMNILAGSLYSAPESKYPGYEIEVVEADTSGGAATAAAEVPIGERLASADIAKGEKEAKKCKSCHTFDNGGKQGTGPNLWNILNRKVASIAGFGYSGGAISLGGEGKVWDFELLDQFLAKPKAVISDTKMNFGGIKKGANRANLILYMHSLSNSPVPLPTQ